MGHDAKNINSEVADEKYLIFTGALILTFVVCIKFDVISTATWMMWTCIRGH